MVNYRAFLAEIMTCSNAFKKLCTHDFVKLEDKCKIMLGKQQNLFMQTTIMQIILTNHNTKKDINA